jgi:hypothetical protein
MFCKHQWEMLSETTTESQLEQAVRVTGSHPTPQYDHQFEQMTERKFIQVVQCTRCGKLKRFKEYI